MSYPEHIRPIERRIIDPITRTALSRHWAISVHDGEAWALLRSSDYDAITAEIAATDMTSLKLRDWEGSFHGLITFVHGNDEDVIHDCSDLLAMHALCE